MRQPHNSQKCRDPTLPNVTTTNLSKQQSQKVRQLLPNPTEDNAMSRIITVLLGFLLFSFTACTEGQISVGTPKNRPETRPPTTGVALKFFQKIAPKKQLNWGVHIKAPVASVLKSDQSGHYFSDGEIHILISRATETELSNSDYSSDPMKGRYPKQTLSKVGNHYFSWVPVPGNVYRFTCSGKVTQSTCQEILDSLQIIKR